MEKNKLEYKVKSHPFDILNLDELFITITLNCNANCPYCINDNVHTPVMMNQETFTKTLNFAKENGFSTIYLHGGEPTIHPSVIDYAKQAKEYGFTVKMFTNAIKMDVLEKLDGILDIIFLSFRPNLSDNSSIFLSQADWKSKLLLQLLTTEECFPTLDSLIDITEKARDLGMMVNVNTMNPIDQYSYEHQLVKYLEKMFREISIDKIFCMSNKAAFRLPNGVVARLSNKSLNLGHLKFNVEPDGTILDHFAHNRTNYIQKKPEIETELTKSEKRLVLLREYYK